MGIGFNLDTEPIETQLEPFFAYLDLKMFIGANDALEELPTRIKTHPKALVVRFVLLIKMDMLKEGVCGANR